LDFIFNDEKTMHDLVGGIGVEAVKAGLATMVGLGVGMGLIATGVTTIAIWPLSAMAVMVLLTGATLNKIDEALEIKKKVIAALKITTNCTNNGIYRVNFNTVAAQELRHNIEAETKGTEPSGEPVNLLYPIHRKN
jgi:hypothetical protein